MLATALISLSPRLGVLLLAKLWFFLKGDISSGVLPRVHVTWHPPPPPLPRSPQPERSTRVKPEPRSERTPRADRVASDVTDDSEVVGSV